VNPDRGTSECPSPGPSPAAGQITVKGVLVLVWFPLRGLVVLVHYAITLEVDSSSGVANDTLDFISLQNNLVEKNDPGALHKDPAMSSLEPQPGALQQDNGTNASPL